MQFLEHLRQLFFYTLRKNKNNKEKSHKRGKKEYAEKRIGKILIFDQDKIG